MSSFGFLRCVVPGRDRTRSGKSLASSVDTIATHTTLQMEEGAALTAPSCFITSRRTTSSQQEARQRPQEPGTRPFTAWRYAPAAR